MENYKKDDIDKAFQDVTEEFDKLTDKEFDQLVQAIKTNPNVRLANKSEIRAFVEKVKKGENDT